MTHHVDILVVLEPEDHVGADGMLHEVGARLVAEGVRMAALTPLAEVAPDAGAPVVAAVTWTAADAPRSSADPAAAAAAGCAGEAPADDLPAVAATLAAHAQRCNAHIVLCPDTDRGRELAPLIAAALGTCALLGVTDAVPAAPTDDGRARTSWVRPVLGGHLEQEVHFVTGAPQVIAVPPGLLPPSDEGDHIKVDVLTVAAPSAPRRGRVRRLELRPPDYRTVDLVHARRIVAVGAGAAGDDDGGVLALVIRLAELLEGSVGATRPVTDDGRLPKERLIGQTGKTVAPELYLALGLSGSPHHMAGVQGAQRILAVNRDPSAPILAFSDAGYVGDLRAVLPELLGLIESLARRGAAAAGDAADPRRSRRAARRRASW